MANTENDLEQMEDKHIENIRMLDKIETMIYDATEAFEDGWYSQDTIRHLYQALRELSQARIKANHNSRAQGMFNESPAKPNRER
jgi:hypothetical protein